MPLLWCRGRDPPLGQSDHANLSCWQSVLGKQTKHHTTRHFCCGIYSFLRCRRCDTTYNSIEFETMHALECGSVDRSIDGSAHSRAIIDHHTTAQGGTIAPDYGTRIYWGGIDALRFETQMDTTHSRSKKPAHTNKLRVTHKQTNSRRLPVLLARQAVTVRAQHI